MNVNLKELSNTCECGKPHDITLKHLFVEKDAYKHLSFVLDDLGFKFPVCLFDTNTVAVAGDKVQELGQVTCDRIVLDAGHLHADEVAVEQCIDQLPVGTDVILAVGSGTIHDIARYVAHKLNIEFISMPTAASVDGYVSTVAAMTLHGVKKTSVAVAPIAVLADTEIIAQAPYRLTASGVGDLLGKYIALTDWRILHLLTGEYLCERVLSLTKKAVDLVADNISSIASGSEQGITQLFEGLLLSGLAMQMVGNSRPASGIEHHLAHFWEMAVINKPTTALHGEKVGVGTIVARKEYDKVLKLGALDITGIQYFSEQEVEIQFVYGKLFDDIKSENDPDPIKEIGIEKFKEMLPQIQQIIRDLPTAKELTNMFKKAGAKTTMKQLDLSDEIVGNSLLFAPYIRSRMTLQRVMNAISGKLG